MWERLLIYRFVKYNNRCHYSDMADRTRRLNEFRIMKPLQEEYSDFKNGSSTA